MADEEREKVLVPRPPRKEEAEKQRAIEIDLRTGEEKVIEVGPETPLPDCRPIPRRWQL
ncbi:MAG: hypothetical protein HYV77_01450 [Candidatus Wildermuthbacteria bacterium]|nr:hypothetical protein [Candidatus Wildermuthbacteria bacterium]